MVREINFKVSGKAFYSLLVVVALIVMSVGVYAGLSATVPSPGHAVSRLQICDVAGEILKSNGTSWTCATDATGSGGASVWSTSGSNIYYDSGNVGIGTASPGQTLDVAGVIQTNSALFLGSVSQQVGVTGNDVFFNTNGVERMRIASTGNVGIGATSPQTKLHVNGDILVEGNDIKSGFFGTDDKRAKINLEVKEGTFNCLWVSEGGGTCFDPQDSAPDCDLGEFAGDSSTVDTGIDCSDYSGTNENLCTSNNKFRTYRACLDLQLE